jgi:hypothetical protein
LAEHDETLQARERARQLLLAATAIRGQVLGALRTLVDHLPRHLPDGTRIEETFVAAAQEQLSRTSDMSDYIASELEQLDRPEALEVAVSMLEGLLDGGAAMLTRIRSSLIPFLEPTQMLDEAGQVRLVDAAEGPLGDVADDLARLSDRLAGLIRARRGLEETARSAMGREGWRRMANAFGEDRTEALWGRVLRADGRFDRLLTQEGLSADQQRTFQQHLLATALRLEAEIADADREKEPKPAPAALTVEEESEPSRPLVVKLRCPDPVGLGDAFTLELLVRNDHLVPITLDSVDLDEELMAGFELLDLVPAPDEQPVRDEAPGLCVDLELEVPAQSSRRVAFELRARRPGNYTGEISVWTADVEVSVVVPNIDIVVAQ